MRNRGLLGQSHCLLIIALAGLASLALLLWLEPAVLKASALAAAPELGAVQSEVASAVAATGAAPRPGTSELWEDDVAAARRRWERHWQQDFPGRGWGAEPNCSRVWMARRAPLLRQEWVAEQLDALHLGGQGRLLGVEIGACQLPVRMPPHVDMQYLDLVADPGMLRSQCFLKEGAKVPDIVDDAQKLATVRDGSYDVLLAAHVMEHLPNVLGALRHWLRVVRPGGLLFVVVPDLCDLDFPFGDRFRLVARPEHFVAELRREGAAAANFPGHALEQGVTVAGVDVLRAATGLPSMGPLRDWWMKKMPPTLENASGVQAVPLSLTPQSVQEAKSFAERSPENVHLHLWNVDSMRDMLAASGPLLAELGVYFEVVDVHSATRTWLNMQEVRVTLRRSSPPSLSASVERR